MPDYFIAQDSSPPYHFVGELAGNIAQGFGWNTVEVFIYLYPAQAVSVFPHAVSFLVDFQIILVWLAVRIREIYSQCAGRFQHPAAFVENQAQVENKFVSVRLLSQLTQPTPA